MTKRAHKVIAASASAEMPGFIKPQLATLTAKAPSGDQRLHEIKFDGYRVQVHLNKGKKRVFTRNGRFRFERTRQDFADQNVGLPWFYRALFACAQQRKGKGFLASVLRWRGP